MNELVKKQESMPAVEQQAQQMHPLVSAAMAAGTELTPENLSKLLEVQKDWEANEARKAYSKAMALFRAECPNINKDSKVDFTSAKGRTNYDHETLNGILRTISPALSVCGLNPTFRTSTEGATIIVTCRVTHEKGHYEETSLPANADNTGNKNAIQAMGSTITYLQRYTLKAMLGLSAGHDTDALVEPEEFPLISEIQAVELDSMLDDCDLESKGFKSGFLGYWKIKDVSEIQERNFDRAKLDINSIFKKRTAAK